MSLEAWGDEGPTMDEPSFESGRESMREDVTDEIDKQREILKSDMAETERMVAERKTPELWEAYTRLNQALQAFDAVEAAI